MHRRLKSHLHSDSSQNGLQIDDSLQRSLLENLYKMDGGLSNESLGLCKELEWESRFKKKHDQNTTNGNASSCFIITYYLIIPSDLSGLKLGAVGSGWTIGTLV